MKKFITASIAVIFFSFLLLTVFNNEVYCQTRAWHDNGKMKLSIVDNWIFNNYDGDYNEYLDYPNGFYRRTCLRRWWPVVVAKEIITGTGTKDTDVILGSEGDTPYWGVDEDLTTLTEIRRWRPPMIVVDTEDMTPAFDGGTDNNLTADEMIIWEYGTIDGWSGVQKSYSFQNPNHDDYVIVSTYKTLTLEFDDAVYPDQSVEMAWTEKVGFHGSREGQMNLHGNFDWSLTYGPGGWNEWELVPSKLVTDKPRKNLWISYYYDDDDTYQITPREPERPGSEIRIDPSTGKAQEFDDIGDPDPLTGMFLSPQWMGIATLHADKSPSDATDDPTIPHAVAYLGFYPGQVDYWTGSEFDFFCGDNIPVPVYEYQGPLFNFRDTFPIYVFQGWGPYTMNVGDEINAVYVIAGGMIDEDLCYSEGAKWYNWYWDDPGAKLDDAGKNALIAQGKDSLYTNVDRAYWAYHNGFDVPDPPPIPDIAVTGLPGKIKIEWGYPSEYSDDMFKDHDTGDDDFLEWRVYRKLGRSYLVDDPQDAGAYNKYELIGTFPKNTTSYEDKAVIIGQDYHYCVTAVDDGSSYSNGIFPDGHRLESSYYKNRTIQAVKSSETSKDDPTLEVLIVPNPYSISTGAKNAMNWTGTNEIQFKQLPSYCTLKIYTVTGDLIKTLYHSDGSGDESWKDMRTESNQYPVSGVYIVIVDDATDKDGKPLPKKISKFVIVR